MTSIGGTSSEAPNRERGRPMTTSAPSSSKPQLRPLGDDVGTQRGDEGLPVSLGQRERLAEVRVSERPTGGPHVATAPDGLSPGCASEVIPTLAAPPVRSFAGQHSEAAVWQRDQVVKVHILFGAPEFGACELRARIVVVIGAIFVGVGAV
jgi:hypothetical protein